MRGTQLKYTDSAAMYETEALVTYGKTQQWDSNICLQQHSGKALSANMNNETET